MKLNEYLWIPTIDWDHYEAKACEMSDAELHYARLDALKAAKANPETEGLYMDELSVYIKEQMNRRN